MKKKKKEPDANAELEESDMNTRKITCLRCHIDLQYSGVYRFHEGTRFGMLGNFFELFVNRESFEIYVCPKCGQVEFFVPSDKLSEAVEVNNYSD
jgi:DNA-directed RNA polymerase subunit RPC12/RpoP